MRDQIKVFDMSNGNEVELVNLTPMFLEVNGINEDSTEISLRLPMSLYGKDSIDFEIQRIKENTFDFESQRIKENTFAFKIQRIEENTFAFKNISAESMALLNALFLTAAPTESCGGDCHCEEKLNENTFHLTQEEQIEEAFKRR
ncbi:MAG: hypothetical protein M0Q13_10130 [Methanothrix sp.]|jgi:hypothetical protein|nr:hypothetical protein [Methanothrix sp.]